MKRLFALERLFGSGSWLLFCFYCSIKETFRLYSLLSIVYYYDYYYSNGISWILSLKTLIKFSFVSGPSIYVCLSLNLGDMFSIIWILSSFVNFFPVLRKLRCSVLLLLNNSFDTFCWWPLNEMSLNFR